MTTYVDDIIQALRNLGGKARLEDIYEEVRRIRTVPQTKNWKFNISGIIGNHCSDSSRFLGKDYFEKVDTGTYALRDLTEVNPSHKGKQTIMTTKKNDFELPQSFETISNTLRTIKDYRDYTDPSSPSWHEYIREFFHIMGFSTEELDMRHLFLKEMGADAVSRAIVGIVFPGENFDELAPEMKWESHLHYASSYYSIAWGILTNGLSLKIFDFENKWEQPSLFWPEFDEIIEEQKLDRFFPVYRVFSCIRGQGEIAPQTGRVPRASKNRVMPRSEYDMDYHIKNIPQTTVVLYDALRIKLLHLSDSVVEKFNKTYIGYSTKKNFCEIWIQKGQIKIWVDSNINKLTDPYTICRDVKQVGHFGTGDTELVFHNMDELDIVFDIIKQSFKMNNSSEINQEAVQNNRARRNLFVHAPNGRSQEEFAHLINKHQIDARNKTDLPKALMNIFAVCKYMDENGGDYTEANKQVTRDNNLSSPHTVPDACTRRIGLSTGEFRELYRNKSRLIDHLSKYYPNLSEEIKGTLG